MPLWDRGVLSSAAGGFASGGPYPGRTSAARLTAAAVRKKYGIGTPPRRSRGPLAAWFVPSDQRERFAEAFFPMPSTYPTATARRRWRPQVTNGNASPKRSFLCRQLTLRQSPAAARGYGNRPPGLPATAIARRRWRPMSPKSQPSRSRGNASASAEPAL